MTSPATATNGYTVDENGYESWVCPRCAERVGPNRVLVQGAEGMEGWHPHHYAETGTSTA